MDFHVMGHNKLKPYACEICDYCTKYPTSLQRHMTIQHNLKIKASGGKLEEHFCDDCTYKTYFKWNLKAHKRKHKEENQYKCEHCEYETAYRHNVEA